MRPAEIRDLILILPDFNLRLMKTEAEFYSCSTTDSENQGVCVCFEEVTDRLYGAFPSCPHSPNNKLTCAEGGHSPVSPTLNATWCFDECGGSGEDWSFVIITER